MTGRTSSVMRIRERRGDKEEVSQVMKRREEMKGKGSDKERGEASQS